MSVSEAGVTSTDVPLYVDLDGTILCSDLLHESFLSAFKASPWVGLQCVGWLMHGRARVKEELAARASIDVTLLPYRESVLAFLREERARGRRIVLATASWTTLAESVARHLGIFDAVLATSRAGNLKGEAKARRIAELSGERSFDYVGDSGADIAVWKRSRHAYVVESGDRLSARIPAEVPVKRVFRPSQGLWRAAVRVASRCRACGPRRSSTPGAWAGARRSTGRRSARPSARAWCRCGSPCRGDGARARRPRRGSRGSRA